MATMQDPLKKRLSHAFKKASAYEALRPSYPSEAVAWLIGTPPQRVVDVGAGTGKFTEQLVEAGHDVVAVDPSSSMLAHLMRRFPTMNVVLGTGEQTGLEDESVDVVAYAQAWHWTTPRDAAAEAARVLRPDGRLALVWNLLDIRVDWVARVHDAMRAGDPRPDIYDLLEPDLPEVFAEPETTEFVHLHPMSTRALADLITTRSYYMASDEEGQTVLLGTVEAAVERAHGRVDDETMVEVPYRAYCARAALAG